MTSGSARALTVVVCLAAACGSGDGSGASRQEIAPGSTGTASTGTTGGGGGITSTGGATTAPALNVIPVSVNGSQCAAGTYVNKPCVTVTVCVPGTSQCQAIDDVLLDTGSFGLRIFKQVLTIPLPTVAAGAGTLGECVQFGGGAADWGPVATASVVLGGEPAVTTPIQVIDSTFGVVPSSCPMVDTSPADGQMNGVLGVGVFAQDCGDGCASSARNGIYYSCTSTACSGVAVPLAKQVQNPVALLPVDNNGLVVQLPTVAPSGTRSLDGAVVLGIGTRANNAPAANLTTYPLDEYGEFVTRYAGSSYSSYLDTGSNGLFFGPPSAAPIPACASPDDSWFCPSSLLSLSATNYDGITSTVSGAAPFQIGNSIEYFSSQLSVFPGLGGPVPPASGFDWGLPFFLGRPIYVGYDGKSSTLGAGTYWAF